MRMRVLIACEESQEVWFQALKEAEERRKENG